MTRLPVHLIREAAGLWALSKRVSFVAASLRAPLSAVQASLPEVLAEYELQKARAH